MLALALLAANVAALLASAYSTMASGADTAPMRATAAARAAMLAPWRDGTLADLAWSESSLGDHDRALAEQARAIRLGPGDAFRWEERAQLLARADRWEDLAPTLARARALAPGSLSRHWTNALLALQAWHATDDATRAVFTESLQSVLQSRHGESFLRTVQRAGLVEPLCGAPAESLRIGRWCESARQAIRRCVEPGISTEFRQWCSRQGVLP